MIKKSKNIEKKTQIDTKKLLLIKNFLIENAEVIEKEATNHHLTYLGKEGIRKEFLDKYFNYHITLVKEVANHLHPSSQNLEKFSNKLKKQGEDLAKNSVKDGLTIQEATNGIIFLKQAMWKLINKKGLLQNLSTAEYYYVSQFIGTLIDTVSSQIAFVYSSQSQEQAKNKEKRLYKLFQEAPAFICILRGKDHVYEISNQLHYQLVGFRDIINKPVREALPEMVDQGIIKLLDKVLKTGKPFIGNEMKVLLQRKKNAPPEERYLNFVYQPIQEADGSYSGIFVHGVDVTDQVIARQEVEESEEKYKSLFNSIDEGFCVIEMIFDKKNRPIDYRFLEANPMFEKQTGLRNALGKTAKELLPNLEKHWFEIYGKVALTAKAVRFTEGSEVMGRWFDVYAFPLGDRKSRKVALLFTDITDRKKAEAELQTQLRQQAVITELGLKAITDIDLRSLLNEAVIQLHDVLNVEYTKVLELLPGGKEVILRAGVGWNKDIVIDKSTVDTGKNSQAGYTLLSKKPVIVKDLRLEKRFNGPPLLRNQVMFQCILP